MLETIRLKNFLPCLHLWLYGGVLRYDHCQNNFLTALKMTVPGLYYVEYVEVMWGLCEVAYLVGDGGKQGYIVEILRRGGWM